MSVASFFTPDHARYEGARPFNIWGLRVFYFLMAAFVATDAWRGLLSHQGEWNMMHAIALCVWATYPTLAILGLARPLQMLPIIFFTIGYKTLFLAFVSYPLWRAGTLAGSPAAEMTAIFLWMPVLIAVVPWKYAFRTYVMPARASLPGTNPVTPGGAGTHAPSQRPVRS
jgi:hypothetical protein